MTNGLAISQRHVGVWLSLGVDHQGRLSTASSVSSRTADPRQPEARGVPACSRQSPLFIFEGLVCSKLEPFVTRKSGHIWRSWPEMTQKFMPISAKVAQSHSISIAGGKPAKMNQNSRQNSPDFRQNSPTLVKLAKFCFTKGLQL